MLCSCVSVVRLCVLTLWLAVNFVVGVRGCGLCESSYNKGHVDPWCLENCVAAAPGNEAFIEGVNTSICEQCFSRLGRHKFAVRWMDRLTSAMLLHEMADLRNAHWLRRQPVVS